MKTSKNSGVDRSADAGRSAVRVILADDHTMVRQGLVCLLRAEADVKVVAEACDGREVVEQAVEHAPDVVVMDVAMPVFNGVEATRLVREARPETAVLGLSMHADSRFVGQMLRAGASGYLFKDASPRELVKAIRSVASGRTCLSPAVADVVVTCYVRGDGRGEGKDGGENGGEGRGDGLAYRALTPREREVLQLFSEGHEAKQIARRLNLSVKTIDTHRYQVMRKLKLRGMADLTRYALREGISSLEV